MAFMHAGVWAQAQTESLSFDPTMKVRIESYSSAGASMALGALHNVNSPLCVTSDDADSSPDCWWYVLEYKTGQYALRNAYTGAFLVWDDVRSDNPIRRYMSTTDVLRGDSTLWTIRVVDEGVYAFESVANEVYRFNVRSGSGVLGTFANTGANPSNNELFYIFKEDGTPYDPGKDYNAICGRDEQGLYWTSCQLDMPVVMTGDLTNPVYYYIRNSRSQNWVEPLSYKSGGWLTQSKSLPKNRFFFVPTTDGVQIRVEGDCYVSAKLTETISTSESDVAVVYGTPQANDHSWVISWSGRGDYDGYSVGVKTCSENAEDNVHFLTGRYYWNDYSSNGICWFSVDGGSTFTFLSSDERHREYLATHGLVIPGDSLPVDTIAPIDTTKVDGLEPIEGKVLFVYRADGRVEAVPEQYIENIAGARNNNGRFSILNPQFSITTKNSGPTFTYQDYEVDSLSYTSPELPAFNSFKINNKFNHHVVEDAIGVFEEDTLITLNVIGIGKTLRPSFKLDEGVHAWIGDSLQHSKVTRVRFDKDVIYTVAHHGQTILRRYANGPYKKMPYGLNVTVRVDFATDHSTGDYQVPTVYVTTDDGTSITSKSYYWSGKVRIDGAGVFPDMEETPMQIKGRGNSSWTSTGKAPYHMKFETAVKPFGLKKGKHWNLIANAQTRSMTSNAVAMKTAQLVETAGANHEIPIELYINGAYRGSYNLTEKVGISNNSIDLDDETYAVMIELDSYFDETYKFRSSSFNLPINIKEPDLGEGTTQLTMSMIQQSVNRVWDGLNNGEDMQYLLDLDYLARFLLVDELCENYELFHPKSTFCYNPNIMDSSSTYVFGPVWDFDWGFGYEYNGGYFNASPTNDYWTRSSMQASSWGYNFRYCGENFDKIYYQLWHRFMNDGSLDDLIDFCDDYYEFAAPSFTHDNTMWRRGDAQAYATVTERAKEWLRTRANYIYDFMGNTLGYNNMGYLDDATVGLLMGDVNDDGTITTSDVVCVFNHMLNLPNEDFEFDRADLDGNDIITIADLILVRNLVLAQSATSGTFYGLPEADAAITTGPVSYSAEGVSIPLTIVVEDGNYSGLQFDLSIPEGMTIDNLDISRSIPDFDVALHELSSVSPIEGGRKGGLYRVSLYSSAKHKLPIGRSELTLELGKDNGQWSMLNGQLLKASLSNVLFSTSLGEDERSGSRTATFTSEELTGIN
ncbi:MAG: CotH kinase family protein, partial [Bacteroidaceae bacterium]|nr:CotH kinase family protein [Bacteroidaceae bacterium]